MRSSAARGYQVAVLRAVRLPIGTAPRRTDRPSWITLTRQIRVSGTYTHRALNLQPPDAVAAARDGPPAPLTGVHRHDLLGGLIHDYQLAA